MHTELCIFMVVSVSNCPHLLDYLWMRRWDQFLWSTQIRIIVLTAPPLCSYTISLCGCVFGEQWGGAT
jgi:hypothetical protein